MASYYYAYRAEHGNLVCLVNLLYSNNSDQKKEKTPKTVEKNHIKRKHFYLEHIWIAANGMGCITVVGTFSMKA